MPASTRSSNKTVNFEVYYSKKPVPKQRYFPDRRKTVRRPDPQDDGGKKQMKFLPDMMKRKSTIQDSDEEGASIEEQSEDAETVKEVQRKRRGRKRNSDVMREEVQEQDHESARPISKRGRKAAPTKGRRVAAPVEPASEDEQPHASDVEEVPKPRLRRQSTMTQMVDGRLPSPGSAEPEFKRAKRTPRTSWGGKGSKKEAEKDKRQRTLTQMVHGLTPLVLDSDEELENKDETDDEIDASHRDFIFGNREEASRHTPTEDDKGGEVSASARPAQEVNGDNENDNDNDEDEYHPTQFIDAPATKRRTPLRSSTRRQPTPAVTRFLRPVTRKSPKTRFGLLSTPEKRGVFEIASSQSPPESPLSTQVTPRRLDRSPLKPRSANAKQVADTSFNPVVESPSKRKQVTFQDGPQEYIPPPTLKKFTSTIPDSDDDAGGFSDSDTQSNAEYGVGEEIQALLHSVHSPLSGTNVGTETQAMLRDIDRACANADEDAAWANRDGSEEPGESGEPDVNEDEVSQELGHQPEHHTEPTSPDDQPRHTAELPPPPFLPEERSEPSANTEPGVTIDTRSSPPVMQMGSSPPAEDFRTQPPMPMFAHDESHEEAEEPTNQPPPSKQLPSSPPVQDFRTQSPTRMFTDDSPEDLDPASPAPPSIQVPRSPVPHLHPEPSHSSQAEQQLHSEYQTYSEYRLPGPPASSMHVAHDSNFSYQATPRPPRAASQHRSHADHNTHPSQATTVVDLTQRSPAVTPRKRKTHAFPRSATTTPQKGGLGSSPQSKPPPLFIPSSFPSPARVTMEGWSSPVVGRETMGESQWGVGSLEDFSIPAPPPGEWVDDEEEEEEEEGQGDEEL